MRGLLLFCCLGVFFFSGARYKRGGAGRGGAALCLRSDPRRRPGRVGRRAQRMRAPLSLRLDRSALPPPSREVGLSLCTPYAFGMYHSRRKGGSSFFTLPFSTLPSLFSHPTLFTWSNKSIEESAILSHRLSTSKRARYFFFLIHPPPALQPRVVRSAPTMPRARSAALLLPRGGRAERCGAGGLSAAGECCPFGYLLGSEGSPCGPFVPRCLRGRRGCWCWC